MKIAVTALEKNLDAEFDPRFGRCKYFAIVDLDTGEHVIEENDAVAAMRGAGVKSPQFLAQQGVSAVVTGHVGPNASRALQAAGIKVYITDSGTVSDAITAFEEGKLTCVSEATVDSHTGLNTQ